MPVSRVPKPRLLFISNLFPDAAEPWRGLDNATLLHALADRWDIRVIAVRPTLPFRGRKCEPRETDRVFHPHYIPTLYVPRIGHRVNPALMARALAGPLRVVRGQFDVALSSWIYPDSCAVARLAREQGFPFAAIAQGSDVHQYLRIPARRKIIAADLPGAAAVITRSADLANQLAAVGLAREKLHPVYNGIDHECFQPGDRAAARKELGLPESARIVLFVGNFYPIKHPMLLLETFAELRGEDEFENTMLVFVGGGPLEDDLRWRANRDCAEGVIFAGRRSAAGVALCMQAADVLCLPSVYEGVPNVILEAFACGLPVVASRVGGIPEVHPGDKFGRLVPPGDIPALYDALRAVLRDRLDREPIRGHARQFTWARAADACDGILRAALNGAVK